MRKISLKIDKFWDHLKVIDDYYEKNRSQFVSKNDLIFMKPLSQLFPNSSMPSAFGLQMYRLLAESKITFNIHTLAAGRYADNMRLFQATGMGSCLITEDSDNIEDLFEKDTEIITYASTDECAEKVKYLLDNESVRKEIAKKGQAKTLKYHSYQTRCEKMNEIFQQLIK